jgi:hypothetical protein
LASLLPGGEGYQTTLRVRVLHAKVRRALLAHKQWNLPEYGVPLNQQDMAVTLLAFSVNALLGVEMVLGFALSKREQLAYLAYWRYLGWLLGVPTLEDQHDTMMQRLYSQLGVSSLAHSLRPLDPCGPGWIADVPDPIEHSKAVFASCIFHLMHPNDLSIKISHHLLGIGYGQAPDQNMVTKNGNNSSKSRTTTTSDTAKLVPIRNNWFYYRSLQCRRFVGSPLADALQLPYHPNKWTNVWLQCAGYLYLMIFRCYTMLCLPYSPLRPLLLKLHIRQLNRFIDTYWKKSHAKRMQAATTKKSMSEAPEKHGNLAASACPFAMVSPPVLSERYPK